MTQRSLLHRAAFSQRSFYTEELLYREACTLRGFDAEKSFTQRSFYTQKLLHKKTLTQRSFYTQKLVRKETFTNRKFYTERTLYTEAFTHRSFYTKKSLHREIFTHRRLYATKNTHQSLYTQILFTKNVTILYTEELLRKETCTHRRVYTQTVAFTHRNFCTEKSLPIFHHVSFFMIIHHLSSSHLPFHALLVTSLRRLLFMSHGVLSVHASSSLPLGRSKLNENPGINSD